ncbi:DeoR/GlpR family DNA-binding transcription regulator [Macrococcus equi]|uniref:DeoR/GlpR family DNA-binding transcription regulator n=1 Tax=Macrococcus equi TaxID=3395462 RepID=UPI0039BE1EFC
MLTIERHETILNLLNAHDVVSLQLLMDVTTSSESTIRRDLSTLEKEGKLIRVHGGAKKSTEKHKDVAFSIKSTTKVHEKNQIAKVAALQIKEHDCIYLDAGSSTLAMIPYLNQQHITVVTNGATHVSQLVDKGIEVYMIGGFIKKETYAAIGVQALDNLKQFRFDKAFIGANGIHPTYGLTTPDIEEAYIKKMAMSMSQKTFFLLDDSKFDEYTFAKISELEQDKTIIITNAQNDKVKPYEKYLL